MAIFHSIFGARSRPGFAEQHPQLPCPICLGTQDLFDVVDFNKCCEEVKGRFLSVSGVPIYYYRCQGCGFCSAPEIARWSLAEFEERIYRNDYALVDPDYLDARPRANAAQLVSTFGKDGISIRHLDYGGGNGLLSDLLRQAGWQSASYDPFVDEKTALDQLGKFDLITAFEVFEHVPNPVQLMANLSMLLSDCGVILFSTLLSDDHIVPGQRLTWWYASPRNGHISLYTRPSLARLASDYDLQFTSYSAGFHGFWRGIPQWAARLRPLTSPDERG